MADDTNYRKLRLEELRREAKNSNGIEREVLEELAKLTEEDRLYVFRPETRCRVCNAEGAADTVNRLLAHAMTHANILATIDPINVLLPKEQRITLASVSNHAKRHFPIAETAKATYRRIVERRAEDYGIDFVEGVGNALTPLAAMEVAMQKGYEAMVEGETQVSPETMLRAADRLQDVVEASGAGKDVADMIIQFDTLIGSVKAHVPQEYWSLILSDIQKAGEVVNGEVVPVRAEIMEAEDSGEAEAYDPDDPDLNHLEDLEDE